MPPKITLAVGDDGHRQRLDRYLVRLAADSAFAGLSRGEIQRWIDEGRVTLSGKPARSSSRVSPGDVIEIDPPGPATTELTPDPTVAFEVLFEDEHLIVLDKPAGLVVHPARGHDQGTLVHGLIARDGFDITEDDDEDSRLRPGIVHRLDKGTSGVMVVAKSARARDGLASLFATHDIERSYIAIARGTPREGTLDTLHGRHPQDRLRFSSRVTSGKRAITHVALEEPLADGLASVVRCRLETGRTHQIRVHLAEQLGTPILGDPLYARPSKHPLLRQLEQALGRQALHARVLGFTHPVTAAPLRFETAPPADFAQALAALRSALSSSPRARAKPAIITTHRSPHEPHPTRQTSTAAARGPAGPPSRWLSSPSRQ